MLDVHAESEVMLNESIQSTRVKLGSQKGQGKLQDNVDLTILTNKSFDLNNCAYCEHRFCMPIGLDLNEITGYNTKVTTSFRDKMREWSNLPTNKRGARPRPMKTLTQHLACMCCKMACLDNINGSGCLKCEQACKNAIEQGSEIRLFFDLNFQYTCEICHCECSVV